MLVYKLVASMVILVNGENAEWREGYLLPTLAWKITCRRFD